MKSPLGTYSAYLRRRMIDTGAVRGTGWFGRKEQAKFLLAAAGLGLIASRMESPWSWVLLGLAFSVAVVGTLTVMVAAWRVGVRAGDNRYNVFTRKTLSAEYRKAD